MNENDCPLMYTWTVVAPSHWVFPLLYDDRSAMGDGECAAFDQWFEELYIQCECDGARLLSVTATEAEPYFSVWFGDWGQPGVTSGEVREYTVLAERVDGNAP